MAACHPIRDYSRTSYAPLLQGSDLTTEPTFNTPLPLDAGNTSAAASSYPVAWAHSSLEEALNQGIILVCACGLLGNVFNLVVLSRRGLGAPMERLERSAHYGLMALALSDALFCISVIPKSFVGHRVFAFAGYDFRLWYAVHADGLVNTFILLSTWLIIAMATSRYIAICHPIRARRVIGRRFLLVTLAVVPCACVALNLPRYFREVVDNIPCAADDTGRGIDFYYYYVTSGPLQQSPRLDAVYSCVYFIVGVVLPFFVLAFCNVKLIAALRRSMRMRAMSYAGRRSAGSSAHRISLTLIIIVAVYMPLVVPTEVLVFFKAEVIEKVALVPTYNLLLAFFNLLQAINFSFNFLLYCVVNKQFRRTFFRLVCLRCHLKRRWRRADPISGQRSLTGSRPTWISFMFRQSLRTNSLTSGSTRTIVRL